MRFTDPSTLCLLLLAVIIALLVLRTRAQLAKQRRRTEAEDAAGSGFSPVDKPELRGYPLAGRGAIDADQPLPGDLAHWEIRMHETARELSAEIDAKLSLLQALTDEASRAAQRLEELLNHASDALSPDTQGEPRLSAADRPCEGFDRVRASGIELDRAIAEAPPAENVDRSRRRDDIYELADYGFVPAEIARRVGTPVGEVELILSLRQK